MDTTNNAHSRDQRSYASRLTVDLPRKTMTALKIHAAERDTTIRKVVTDLLRKEVEGGAA